MLKRLLVTGIVGSAGFLALGATPALADDPQNTQIVGVQPCRAIGAAVVGAAIHNLLGVTDESGDCVNGSQANAHKYGKDLPKTR